MLTKDNKNWQLTNNSLKHFYKSGLFTAVVKEFFNSKNKKLLITDVKRSVFQVNQILKICDSNIFILRVPECKILH